MIVAVFAEVPLPGRCLKPLTPYHDEAWLARLSAAMLRDTLDGLESVPADRYVVLADTDDEGRRVLERHLPLPWTFAASIADLDTSDGFIVARTHAPSAHLEPLIAVAAKESFTVVGEDWLYGERASCKDPRTAEVVVLPPATIVDSQSALDALLDELRRHHERAPRTAHLAMTT
ncbi:MAG: hypothetical protein U0270_22415 [Labilithrix sp.]